MGDASVLIVSASTGTGHAKAAAALEKAYGLRSRGTRVEHVDLLELAPRWVRAAYGGGYELISTKTPWLWREIYHRTDTPAGDLARWGPLAHSILFREFRRLLLSRRWSLCLSTHFLPGQLAAGTAGAPPFAMVITDMTLHRFWAQPRVARYFVANEGLKSDLAARLGRASIEVTGIPVGPEFVDPPSRPEARRSLGIEPGQSVVLVMGGGLGLGVEEMARAALRAGVPGLLVIAMCGRNEAAATRLRGLGDPRLRVTGYVHDVARHIAAADLVVTKPGGLTTSEVLAVGRPLLLTRPIPGQEEGNARVLEDAGAALRCSEVDLPPKLAALFADPVAMTAMSTAASLIGRPGAALAIVDAVAGDRGAVLAA